ncbi:SusC/RagA family TonB-linked outer membrane protein [Confluentibacter sediminis]|uniref:SusC/RagA family TonB-linked outer membrane protein n=1 Tax=Confluentibacter sediminis TaxID=2219045 RepID=UPI000DAD4364|nr:SusC/RagA family TonB-linked outer membrane protein [Confluentibacter sediminis]
MIQKVLKLLFVFCLFSFQNAKAQTTVTGTITDASSGIPLLGASIVVKGTSTGVSSDFDGNYSIQVPNSATALVVTYVGYAMKEVLLTGSTTLNIALSEDTEALDEVVVTALGIKRESKALGYSLTEVGGEELSNVKQVNAINSLQGKVAGVNITGSATGPAGTSNVVIRGASSVSGTNQPLYVVDGIPINNQNLGSASRWGGSDFGDGISSINPDDIASISVLKGGAAAALYGSAASDGVILITTKTGKNQKGLGVEYSGSALMETVNTGLYDFQKEYGQGNNGLKPTSQLEALDAGLYAWGGKLDGSSVPQFDGESRPYSYTGNNIDKFYRTASTLTNTVAISKAGEGFNLRFSGTDLTNKDITPNSGLNRKSFSLNGGVQLTDKLTLDISGKYILENVHNRPRLADSPGNSNFTVALSPANINVLDYKPGVYEEGTTVNGLTPKPGYNQVGSELLISTGSNYHQNPYFVAYRFSNESKKNRFIGSSTLRYNVTDWLYALGRVGIDQFTARITNIEPYGTAYKNLGGMTETTYNVKTIDADFMLGIDKDFGDKFSTKTILGANSNSFTNERLELNGQNFVITTLEDVSNVENKNYSYSLGQTKKGSLYFSTELSYDNYLFLTITGRNDWFSTLSLAGKTAPNSYFYPSVSGSFLFSDAFEMPDWLSYGKFRAGYSDIGGGARDPYSLSLAYGITDTYTATGPSISLGSISKSQLPNLDLKPYSKSEYEFGLDLKFFNNRLGLDLAYYSNKTTDDIVPITVSNTTGYSSAVVNIGEVTNKGIEFLLKGTPIQTDNFGWNVTYNLGYNKNEVVKTDDDGNPFFSGDESYGVNSQSGALVGKPMGAIYGTTFVRNDQGQVQYDSDGTPTVGPNAFLGNGVAPYSMGLTNNFNYKNFNLNFLIDAKFGADIFSGTSAYANYYGYSKNTLVGRENGLAVSGVDESGNSFSTTIPAANVNTYYQKLYSIAEANMQDADFIKFREVSLGYNFPSSLLSNTSISSINISFIARNLFYIMKHTENIDPESAFNNTYGAGLERFGLPSTRSYGLSLNVKF